MQVAGVRTKTASILSLILMFSGIGLHAQDTVTDIDGNVYRTVTIGTQVWMAENLRTTRFRNGDAIPTTNPAVLDISGERNAKYQWVFEDDPDNLAVYGRLYTWHAVTDSRTIAPVGWHVPTDAEWKTLTDFLGGDGVAGGKMKEAGTAYWRSPNTGATNESGFAGLPGGSRPAHGAFDGGGVFVGDKHHYGAWWTASERNAATALSRCLSYRDGLIHVFDETWSGKNWGFAVRCVRDASAKAAAD
jgi:uncharacterized protein (TIGR02145 family)